MLSKIWYSRVRKNYHKKKLSYHTALKIASFLEFFVQEGVYRYPGLNPHDSPLKIQGETYGP